MGKRRLKELRFVNSLGGRTPACVNRETGIMLIDRKWWNTLPFEHRYFILLHEWAHFVLNTSDEFRADHLAFLVYAKKGYSITQAVYALTRVLSYKNQEHTDRTLAIIDTAKQYDYLRNNNQALARWYMVNYG